MELLGGIRQKGEEHVCCSAWCSSLGSVEGELWGEVLQENRVFLFLPAEAQFRQNSDGLEYTHMSKWYLQIQCDGWNPPHNQGLTSEMQYCNYVKI